eukprot:1740773-Pyramimonas_sp.AAC.3
MRGITKPARLGEKSRAKSALLSFVQSTSPPRLLHPHHLSNLALRPLDGDVLRRRHRVGSALQGDALLDRVGSDLGGAMFERMYPSRVKDQPARMQMHLR